MRIHRPKHGEFKAEIDEMNRLAESLETCEECEVDGIIEKIEALMYKVETITKIQMSEELTELEFYKN